VDVPLSSPLSHSGYLLLKALLRLAGLLCLVSVATFVLLSYSPIDPIKAYIGNDLLHVPPEQYARIAARWGLDQPLWLRYWHWFSQVLQGDLGYSMLYNAPVSEVIGQRFAASFLLLAGAWLLSGFFGILLGLCAGRYLNRWPDRLICRFAYLLASLPTFWVGLLLLALFAVHWPLLPVCCAWTPGLAADEVDWAMRLRHLLLPVTTLALLGVGNIALHTRGRVAEVLESDFIRLAHAAFSRAAPRPDPGALPAVCLPWRADWRIALGREGLLLPGARPGHCGCGAAGGYSPADGNRALLHPAGLYWQHGGQFAAGPHQSGLGG